MENHIGVSILKNVFLKGTEVQLMDGELPCISSPAQLTTGNETHYSESIFVRFARASDFATTGELLDGAHQHVPELLNWAKDSEVHTLGEGGKFRVVAMNDLAEFAYNSDRFWGRRCWKVERMWYQYAPFEGCVAQLRRPLFLLLGHFSAIAR